MSKRSHVNKRSSELPTWALYGAIGGFLLLIPVIGILIFNTVKNVVSGTPIQDSQDFTVQNIDDPSTQVPGGAVGNNDEPLSPEATVPPGWDEGRVTILLMGIDERQIEEEGPPRTDTMIVVTVDPITQTAGMISIPRDLWVQIPDLEVTDRVNTAYRRGELNQYPGGGGPALALKTIQQHVIGREVPYYASINFQAFRDTVDYLGCVPITVEQTIVDETYPDGSYGYDPFTIEAGEHCLGGDTLLKYARTRATYGSDFDRARRQQQVLYAIRDEVLTTGQLPQLISQAPEIYGTVQDGFDTNLSLNQLIALARLAAEIPEENICSVVISEQYVTLATQSDGTQVLVPDRLKLRELVNDVFTATGSCAPGSGGEPETAPDEDAQIIVLNGTAQNGVAGDAASLLSAGGLTVNTGNADNTTYQETVIYNYTGKDETARYIAGLLDLPDSAIVVPESGVGNYDIEVVLGTDFASR